MSSQILLANLLTTSEKIPEYQMMTLFHLKGFALVRRGSCSEFLNKNARFPNQDYAMGLERTW